MEALLVLMGYKTPDAQLHYWKKERGWDLPAIDEDVEALPLVGRLLPLLRSLRKGATTVRAITVLEGALKDLQGGAFDALSYERALHSFTEARPLIGALLQRGRLVKIEGDFIYVDFAEGSLEIESISDPMKIAAIEDFFSRRVGRSIFFIFSAAPEEQTKLQLVPISRPPAQEILPKMAPSRAPLQEVPVPVADTPEQVFAELFDGHKIRAVQGETSLASVLDVLAALGYAEPKKAWFDIQKRAPEVVTEIVTYSFSPGQPTPVASSKALLKILAAAPNPPDKSKLVRFREWAARTLDRVVQGDITLADEIKERSARKQVNALHLPEESRERLSKIYLRLSERLEGKVPESTIDNILIRSAELIEGRSLTAIKPRATEGRWHTPAQIAERYGVRLFDVGTIIKKLGLKGEGERGIEGISEPYHTTTEGGQRDVVCFRYTEVGAQRIIDEIERQSREAK